MYKLGQADWFTKCINRGTQRLQSSPRQDNTCMRKMKEKVSKLTYPTLLILL